MAAEDMGRLFGETAVDRGFITADQFDHALEKQDKTQEKLSKVLVDLGYITPFQEKTIQRFCQQAVQSSSADITPNNVIGKTLGGCKILRSVGSGGMGNTYLAHHERLDREVCVKLLHPRLTRIEGMAERFQREARAAASLSHPNVVQVFDFDQRGSMYFMIMEYVKGKNLKEILEGGGPLPPQQAIWVVSQVLQGLTAAHELGIVHRDMKPANILYNEEINRVYITDFGTVRILSSSTSETLSAFGEILGTPQYMAPEQATADEVDGRTDLYGVGMLLFELLEGHPPFTGNSVVEVLEKQILRPIPPLGLGRDMLNEFVQKMCAKSRDDRYSTAVEAGRALDLIYRRMVKTTSTLADSPQIRLDPTRAAGSSEPTVASTSIEAIAGRLRQSQILSLVSFEAPSSDKIPLPKDLRKDQNNAPFQSSNPALRSITPGELALQAVQANREFGRDSKDTHQILSLAINGDLSKAIPELTADARGQELIPELLLLLWKNDKKEEILRLSPQLETAMPTVPAIPFFTGLAYASKEDYEKARSSFAVAVALDTSHVPAQIHLATCLLKLHKKKEARRTLRRAALLNPSSVLAAVRFAEYLAGPAKDYPAAAVAFEKAIHLAPDRMVLRSKLGAIFCHLDQLEDAKAVAKEIVEWSGQESDAKELCDLIKRCEDAHAAESNQQLPESEENLPFEDAVKPSEVSPDEKKSPIPPDIRARLELMRLAVASEKWPWVIEIYVQGVEAYPDVSQFHLAFGQAALKLNRPSKAAPAFERALQLKSNSKKAREGLKKAKEMLSDQEKSS